jgi:hypothetical protein
LHERLALAVADQINVAKEQDELRAVRLVKGESWVPTAGICQFELLDLHRHTSAVGKTFLLSSRMRTSDYQAPLYPHQHAR